MKESVVKPGDVVSPKNGRFANEVFIVLRVDDDYVYIANGKKRKSDTPKKKKIKHCILGMGHSEHIARKLEQGLKVTNNELRITVNKYEGGANAER